jgi:hypothetical protein
VRLDVLAGAPAYPAGVVIAFQRGGAGVAHADLVSGIEHDMHAHAGGHGQQTPQSHTQEQRGQQHGGVVQRARGTVLRWMRGVEEPRSRQRAQPALA